MARSAGAAGTPATLALDRAQVAYTRHAYDHDPSVDSFGLEAAAALGLDPDRVLKTLVVRADGSLVVALVPVSGRLDLKALAACLGVKRATMADTSVAERATGYVVGGISPFGQRRRLSTVLDESALAHSTVYVSGGRRGLDLGVSPVDLVRVLAARTAALRRP